MIDLEIKRDRKEIAKIIERNIELLKLNPKMSQEIADSIIVYLIEKATPDQRIKQALTRLRTP